ncbi:hypothetical protein CH337_06365 [Rhodoblastus acidophilus]|nr:hypothetical protein CH337_06365 [Rhodoblastus acidophilus]
MNIMAFNIKSERDEFQTSVDEAVNALRAALAEVASAASDRKEDAAEAVRRAGARAFDRFDDLADDAKTYADQGASILSKSVASNPLAALALAAGAGFLLAQLSRGEHG